MTTTTAVAERITFSIPSMEFESTMSWETYNNVPLAVFLADALHEASPLRGIGALARFSSLIRAPNYRLFCPGRPQTPNMDWPVNSFLAAGDWVMILTEEEERLSNGIPTGTTGQSFTYSLPSQSLVPPLFRRDFNLFNMQQDVDSGSGQGLHPISTSSSEDEEFLPPTRQDTEGATPASMLPMVMRALSLLSTLSNDPSIVRNPQQLPVEGTVVKTVINIETFRRVCQVVEPPIQVQSEQHKEVSEEPEDAGLGACSVCLSLLATTTGDQVELRKMPNCTHIFHTDCLSQWLTMNAITCPACRSPAVTDPKDYGYLGYGMQPDEYTPAFNLRSDEDPTTPRPQPRPASMSPEPRWLPRLPMSRPRR